MSVECLFSTTALPSRADAGDVQAPTQLVPPRVAARGRQAGLHHVVQPGLRSLEALLRGAAHRAWQCMQNTSCG
jgi:hypothetical protein